MRVRTLLADHSELSLIGLRAILSEVERVDLVGVARDTIELQAQLVRTRPDLVLIDHTAVGFSAAAVRDGVRRSKRTRFVAITPPPSAMTLLSAVRAGVTSYIRKDCGIQEIIDAVCRTADGEHFYCGQVLATLERAGYDTGKFLAEPLSCDPVVLTERECEVIGLIAEGRSYTRIAEELHLSAHTVTTHRRNIMQKLGVNNTAAVVMYAVKNGLVSPNRFLFNPTEAGR
ncbi:MAG: response regulator transcription factor [Flavobacteriales bacterium]|jgi:DNA-binding NarL/FixJ family response regulator|nr:response regulator transcription factor [Flavobacteriales bacterium]